jgi:hypothetical protein
MIKILVFPENRIDYYWYPNPKILKNLKKEDKVPSCFIWWNVFNQYVFHCAEFDYEECLQFEDYFKWTEEDMKNEWYLISLLKWTQLEKDK